MKIYKVGGCVRDKLLGLEPNDIDYVVVGSTEAEFMEKYPEAEKVGQTFPVYLYKGDEYAFARKERKTDKGHKGFECEYDKNVTLEEDLYRRDLTINAIAMDEQGNIIDPYGGKEDIKNKLLKPVSSAFREDPLRVLRVARFAAKMPGFKIDPKLLGYMSGLRKELKNLPAERIWKETEKALGMAAPWRFFRLLQQCRCLEKVFPELKQLDNVPAGPFKYHGREDSLDHCLDVMRRLPSEDPVQRFAALCHDIGKGLTPEKEWPHHYKHDANGPKQVEKLCNRLKVPNTYRKAAEIAAEYHMRYSGVMTMKPKKAVELLLNIQNKYPGGTQAFIDVVATDRKWSQIKKTYFSNFVKGAVGDVNLVKLPEEYQNKGLVSKDKIVELWVRAYKSFKKEFLGSRHSEITNVLEKYESLIEDAKLIADYYMAINWGKENRDKSEIDHVNFNLKQHILEIEVSVPSRCSCCGDDDSYIELPLDYLWDSDWKERIKKDKEEKDRIAEKKSRERQELLKFTNKEIDRKVLKGLKKKYKEDDEIWKD